MTLKEKVFEVANYYRDEFGGTPESVPDWYVSNKLNERTQATQKWYKPIDVAKMRFILLVAGEYPKIKTFATERRANDGYVYGGLPFEIIEGMKEYDLNFPQALEVFMGTIEHFHTNGVIADTTKASLLALIESEDRVVYGSSWAEENNIFVDSREVGLARGGKP